tara:strand:+ start:295 stop:789 length:495 start_codon:yes stop_codon:yes gene_type:complete
MTKVKVIIPIIMIIIIAGALTLFVSNEDNEDNVRNRADYVTNVDGEWMKSGSFEIDKSEYNIGEKIFLSTTNLLPGDKGTVQFLRPINDTHHKSYIKIPFDGMAKSKFNYYFEPRFNKNTGICSTNDLAGNWVVKFIGTEYKDMNFKIHNKTSDWDDRMFEPIC